MEEKFVRVRTLTPASRAYQRMRPTLALGRAWRRLLALFPIIAPIFILTVWWFEVPGLTTPFDVHPLVFAAGLAIFWFVVSEFLSYLALLMRFFLHRFVQGLLGAALGAVSLLSFAALFINVAMAGWEIGDWDSLPALALFAAVCAYAAYISWCFFVAGLAPMLVNATNYSVARGFIPAWRNLFALRRFAFVLYG